MSNVVAGVDSVVQKIEQYALVLVGGGIAAYSAVDPQVLPHKFAAAALVVNNILIVLKPKLQKAVDVTEKYNSDGTTSVITSLVDRVTGEVKHVITAAKSDAAEVEHVATDEVAVVKDEVHQAPAVVQTTADAKATADAAAARADLEKQAAEAKATLASVEAALNSNPPTPAGPGA